MANQQQIDAVSEQISALINKSREELVFDLHKLALEIDNNTQFVNALNDLDISDILKKKLSNVTNIYVNAHRNVLESTVQFANINPNTLTSFIQINQEILDNTVINTVASHIRNEVAKGIIAGVSPQNIAASVASSSISTSQIETLVNTTLNSYSRTVTNTMMNIAPEDTLYHYIGPVDDKTRSKCLEMASAGRITKKEILSFGSEVLVEGGGFNCRHKWEVAGTQTSEFHLPKEASKRLSSARQ